MLGECHISFFILSSLYFPLTLSILGRYSDLGVSANLHISFYPPYNEIMADLEVVPLATIQEKMSSVASHFSIELPDFETGTILNIQDLTNVWEVDSLNHLQGALQDLVPPFSMSNFEQYLYAIGVGELGKVDRNFYEDFDYKVSAAYNGDVLNLTIARNELDVNILTTEYKDVFDLEKMQADDYSMAS